MSRDERECFRVASLEVKGLWGREHKKLMFNERVNILIGPNASGKTTLLNILYYVVTANLRRLAEIEFSSAKIELRSFSSNARRTIRVNCDDGTLSVKLGNTPVVTVPLRSASRDDPILERQFARAMRSGGMERLREIRSMVPTAWLPVSRRLSISDPEDESPYQVEWDLASRRPRRPQGTLEPVDHRLSELAEHLHRYRFHIEQTLSSRYKEFEQRVLEIVLFDEDRDKFPMSIPAKESLGDESKQLLIRAFESAGLLQPAMRRRIDKHFEALDQATHNLDEKDTPLHHFFVLPLIPRTGDMIAAARTLDEARETLFEPMRRFERLASKFLVDKTVRVDPDGSLGIAYTDALEQKINPHRLSSGEKQILT